MKQGKKTQVRLFLVDDHAVVRDGLAQLIESEPDLTVCGEAASAE
ncbi:MAG: DNA-binding response regulator, partial [Chthoniobacterales bacterium]